jgi:hypothetical protein
LNWEKCNYDDERALRVLAGKVEFNCRYCRYKLILRLREACRCPSCTSWFGVTEMGEMRVVPSIRVLDKQWR